MMRTVVLLGLASVSLAACGGGEGAGPQSAGSVAPVTSTGGSVYDQFVHPTEARTYSGVGGVQHFEYLTDDRACCNQQAQKYGSTSSTVRSSIIQVTYDPREAIYTLVINDPNSGLGVSTTRFQDPANRTNFGGSVEPQWGTPDMSKVGSNAVPNIQYLQAGEGDPTSPYRTGGSGLIDYGTPTDPPNGTEGSSYQSTTFFYEKPGTTTKYVTLAGYVNNRLSFGSLTENNKKHATDSWKLDRGAFAYGIMTDNSAVPTSGTATYSGNMLGTMIYNPTLDNVTPAPSLFQWLTGTSTVKVDFGTGKVALGLAGVVLDPQIDRFTSPTTAYIIAGSTFAGSGSATIDLIGKGGFTGSFVDGSFTFTAPTGQTFSDKVTTTVSVAVAGSAIDGAFYGPAADEVGGGFRVVGGVPDQRIDILGAFTGKK